MHVISITSCCAFGVGHFSVVISITCCSALGVGHVVLFLLS